MNIWSEMVQPGLFALLYTFLFLIPAWALYRWGVLKDKVKMFDHSIRLLIVLISGVIFLGNGGEKALDGFERLLRVGELTGLQEGAFFTFLVTILIFIGALFIAHLLDMVVFDFYMGKQLRRDVPKLLRDMLKLVIMVLSVGFILIRFYNVNATAVGGGAAVVTLVLGLAMQNVLGDLLSGVVLQFERPFSKGDWIKVGDVEGEVVEINWRATRLNTRQNWGVVIPNSVIAKAEIHNLNMLTPTAAIDRFVGTEYKEPPNRVKGAIMEGILQCADVARQPAPQVLTHEYGDHAIIYRMRFWLRDFTKIPRIADEVLTNIWYVFKRYDITIPWPIRNVYMREEEELTVEEQADNIADLLRQVDIFAPLSRNQIEILAQGLAPKFFGRGELLVKQGDEGNSFFVIEWGRVEVLVTPEGSSMEASVAVLGPRNFFGEMSLLAGDRRNATVKAIEDIRVLIIDKDAFGEIIREYPEVATEMAAIYYQRTQELTEAKERIVEGEEKILAGERGEEALLKRIQRFFGL